VSKPRIGIIIGSTREGRFGETAARWVHGIAAGRDDMAVELIDLRDHDLPFFGTGPAPEGRGSDHPPVKAWQAKVASLDGFVIAAAEYNHGPTAVLKNALDFAYAEWNRKPVAFVGYGGVGGARAVQQLRLTAVELQLAPIRQAVHILGPVFMEVRGGDRSLDDFGYLTDGARTMLDDLAWWATALKTARAAS
jgi:NAD(P)H-dependent FMN reductase